MSPTPSRPTLLRWLLVVLAVAGVVSAVAGVVSRRRAAAAEAALLGLTEDGTPPAATDSAGTPPTFALADSMLGRSGALRYRTLVAARALALPGFLETFGERALHQPAMRPIRMPGLDAPFTLVVLRPFGQKRGEVLNGFRLGRWPSERWMMARNYWNPDGFIEVQRGDERLPLSAHFTLGEFLTHDQERVWPKYLLVEEVLIDKLELVLTDLGSRGVPVDHVRVLSGFRAPYYNDRIVGEGAARTSRHQYGDAADLILDADRNGRMDDVNRDGRVDIRDADAILRAVERVERQHPALVGGTGVYAATGPSGPFVHVDVRGTAARWRR